MFSKFIFIIFIYFSTIHLVHVNCYPQEMFMKEGVINNRTYFYYNKVDKILVENDLKILQNNFDSLSFDFIKYLDCNGNKFGCKNPNNHYNVYLNISYQILNYYYSFPFSHSNYDSKYFEFLSKTDLIYQQRIQYWRPYLSVNEKNLVQLQKFNLTSNYTLNTDLKIKIYNIIKLYNKK